MFSAPRTCRPTLASRARSSAYGRRGRRMAVITNSAKFPVMVNSCTGKMGQEVADAVLRAGLTLVPYTLCGPGEEVKQSLTVSGHEISLVGPDGRDEKIESIKSDYPGLVMVDYTVPNAVHQMADFYVRHKLPFVMGTTGGDREKLLKDVQESGVYAVIAPQMGKQVVAFQAGMQLMADNFPGAFSGYTLKVTESHQSSKKDTSGTAKAIVASFEKLGVQFNMDEIELVREPAEQTTRMKVPEEFLLGHAYHTYQLLSPDGTVYFEFQHNVCGRRIYAEGTVDAVLFLSKQVEDKASQTVYNMIDVLKAGAMR